MKKSIRILSGIGLTLFLAAAVQTFRSGGGTDLFSVDDVDAVCCDGEFIDGRCSFTFYCYLNLGPPHESNCSYSVVNCDTGPPPGGGE